MKHIAKYMLTAVLLWVPLFLSAASPNVVAHRGYWQTYGSAQNSLSSIHNAIKYGVWGSEFDVWITSDGQVVVNHDPKTTNGIMIQNATFDSLRSYSAKLADGEMIPLLQEYLGEWNHSKTKLVLEIKTHASADRNRAVTDSVFSILKQYGVKMSDVRIIAFDWDVICDVAARGYGKNAQYLNGDKTPAEVKAAGVWGIDYSYNVLHRNPQWIADAHKLGMSVNVWTVDSPAKIHEMTQLGVDFITTNRPALVTEQLKK